jgi:GT2 family glycosyltransferase
MSLSSYPFVSVVTLTWNTTSITCDFLRSINAQCSYPNLEVIVVDNGSKEDPTEAFMSIRPDVKVIRNGRNLGFTGGNNIGISAAKGDYLFIVNNDTEFTPGLLEGLIEVFQQYPDAGMVSPKFHYYFHKGIIEYAGYNLINPVGKRIMVNMKKSG